MAVRKTSNNSALKLIPKTPRTKTGKTPDGNAIIREFLDGISIDREPVFNRKHASPFALGASQVNADLALAAQCESEGDIGIEDDEYIDFLLSSEYQTLQSTFIEEVQNDVYALVNLVWRAYNAGRLSPDRLEPDSAYVRKERRRRADLHQQEHLKRMAAK